MTGCITFYSAMARITMVAIEMLPVQEQNYNGILVFPVIFILTRVFHCHGLDDGDILKRIDQIPSFYLILNFMFAWQMTGALLRNPHKDDDLDLPLFDLGIVACATKNFYDENKLSEGGFEPVYKVLIYN
ncbi:hypothetical protein SADUNF_Sadunf16G0274000 [Salix dunnii]|uniref:Uncharacterized protein n=1 Tax=Salix dunnii TaxID=1413687 RepID=A0A835JDM4_9ROSI|nr:hypothetical protein SADUNF_Sadunf16G0274000 [Salix dunnii]